MKGKIRNALMSFVILFATSVVPTAVYAMIQDGAHNGGSQSFFFLPPMVDNPSFEGIFEATLDPLVEILDLQKNMTVASFTNAGTGSSKVRVDSTASHYIVNLHTSDLSLRSENAYRIRVSVAGTVQGFADVFVVDSAKELKTVDATQYVPLLNGTTLPIKFSILQGYPQRVPASCKEIHDTFPSAGDGIYNIEPIPNNPIQVHCLMSADGGGWTLVLNFPWPGNTNGVPGWTSGEQVNTAFTDLTQPFKLSDSLINNLKTVAFRAHGTATYCYQGPCTVDTTLYWSATCQYSSNGIGPGCGNAFFDYALTTRDPHVSDVTACSWHYGLVASSCDWAAVEMGTSHIGDHVFVGIIGTSIHAYDGRTGENPSVQAWVK